MRWIFIAFLAGLSMTSCNPADKTPEYVTYRTLPEGAGIEYERNELMSSRNSNPDEGIHPGLDSLVRLRLDFFDQKTRFDMEKYRSFWEEFRDEIKNRQISEEEALMWFNLTGFLFQVTGDAMVAEELERVVYQHFLVQPEMQADSLILPYVFTRNTDFIHLNLYLPASIQFEHSLGGDVSVSLETDFPENGKARVLFGMQTKQYIELFVRIPSWANDASVTVKGVKYLASPGSYTKVAKKWKEGDVVEIEFSNQNLPPYMKPGS